MFIFYILVFRVEPSKFVNIERYQSIAVCIQMLVKPLKVEIKEIDSETKSQ